MQKRHFLCFEHEELPWRSYPEGVAYPEGRNLKVGLQFMTKKRSHLVGYVLHIRVEINEQAAGQANRHRHAD